MVNFIHTSSKRILGVILLWSTLFTFSGFVKADSLATEFDKVISGTVLDEKGEPLPGVNVVVKGTTIGTTTDLDGNYRLSVPDDANILVFSFVGFATEEVAIAGQTKIDINLSPDVSTLEEVVVIGYGTKKQEDLIGAVASVSAEQIKDIPVNTFEQTLAGQVSGVQLRQTGNPGGGPEVIIRGIGTLSNNAPLYVVDGIPLGNTGSQNDNSILNAIAPDDIESISVLKDATAKAIYGSRASNGVIMITTKRGKVGKPTVTFSAYGGVRKVLDFDKPNNLNARELAIFQKERLEDRFLFNGAWGGLEQAHYTRIVNFLAEAENDPALAKGTDWFDEITRTAYTQNYHFSVSGGTENFKYNISAGYRDEEGVVIGTNFERFTLRANIDANINDRITVGMNLAPTFATNTGADTEPNSGGFSAFGAINATNWVDPTAPVFDENGALNPSTHGLLSRQDFNGNPVPFGSGLFWTASPVARILTRRQESKTNTLNLTTFIEVGLIGDLKFKSSISLNFRDRQTFNYTPKTLPLDGLTPPIDGRPNSGSNLGDTRNVNTIFDNQLHYNKAFNKHNIDAIAVLSVEKRKEENVSVISSNFIDEDFIYPSSGNTDPGDVTNFGGGFGRGELSRIGVLGRISYDYDGKYYITGAFRTDATSRFGEDNRWGNFPAVSGAWRVSGEPFFEPLISVISNLRVEAGWGISGNDAGIGNFAWQGNIARSNYILGGSLASGNALAALPNTQLTWEETEQLDLGIDIGLLDNKFNIGLDWYKTQSKGFLGNTPLPTATGLGSIIDNVGEIENKGIEINLSTNNLVRFGSFTYDFNANVTVNRNEILSIQNEMEQPIGQAGNGTRFAILRVGDPIALFRGFEVLGFYSEEDINDPNVAKYPEAVVGSVKVTDGNGDGIIEFSETDYVDIGNPHPDFIFGMRHSFRYMGFDLAIVMSGGIGQQIYDQKNQQLHNLDGVFNVDREVFENRYRPGVPQDIVIPATENIPDGAVITAREASDLNTVTIPTTKSNTTRYWRSPNSFHIKDADYLWIKNITLGYKVNMEALGMANFIQNARVYFSVQNPIVFSEYETGSPEIQKASDNIVRNVNEGSYPNSTFYSLGINVTF